MLENKGIGWLSLGLFALAIGILGFLAVLLVFFPTALPEITSNVQVFIAVSGGLALLAALFGFTARRTPQGKIGGVGGLLLCIAIAVFLSFTLVAFVEVTGAVVWRPVM